MRVVFDGPIAAEDPDQLGISVPIAEPLAVHLGILRREDLRTGAPFLVPLVTPGRQKADHDAQRIRFLHDVVNVIPVVVLRTYVDVRTRWIVVDQRCVAVSIRSVQAVQFGQCDGLHDGESSFRAVFEIPIHLLTVQPVEQFPGRVTQPEERLAVLVDEEPAVVADLQIGCRGPQE